MATTRQGSSDVRPIGGQLQPALGDFMRAPDSVLVRHAQDGIDQAFAVIVDRYHAGIYSLAYRMCGPTDAEDLTQEVFLKALGKLDRFEFRNQASLRTWLYRIAMNSCINELRRAKRRRSLEGPSLDAVIHTDDGAVRRTAPDESCMPHVIAEREETREIVHEIIRRMSPKYQQVLVLIDLEGMEYEEAAEVIGCRIGTVKSRLSRAREHFASKLRAHMRAPRNHDIKQAR